MTVATRVIPESHADILDQKVLAHVATIGPDGPTGTLQNRFGTLAW